ncbi:hypothetical protein AJ87_43115 [Rhizobium yanglingense]|nr:hypothetical protein AJ87_43115 [Rhizobium yanglingense]
MIERKALRESLDLQLDLALQSAVFRQKNRPNKGRETLDFYRIARLRQDQGDLYIARKVRLCLDPFRKTNEKAAAISVYATTPSRRNLATALSES